MDTLTRAMRDAAQEAPTTLEVGEEQWVDSSWRSGRRRRAVRGVAAGAGLAAAGALVVSLVSAGVGGMPSASVPADGASRTVREGVTSYPQRIGHQWWVRDLPSRPGPVAGVVATYHADGDRSRSEWDVVTPGGGRYRLPTERLSDGVFPAVSDDGTKVGWIADDGAYRVQDTVDGAVTTFDQVGAGNLVVGSGSEFIDGRSYGLQVQSPGFFSPSGEAVAMLGSSSTSQWGGVLVLQSDGSTTEVPVMGQAAGWLDDDRLLGRTLEEQTQQGDEGVDLVVWDRRTRRTTPLTRIELPQAPAQTVNSLEGQFWGTVRSDGTLWVAYSIQVPSGSAEQNRHLAGYAMPSGARVGVDGRVLSTAAPVELSGEQEVVSFENFWHDDLPLTGTDGDVTAVVPAGRPGDPLVVVHSAADVTQVIWAQDAIDGSPSWSLFGTSTFALFWWWKEIALVALALGAYRWWLARRRRRRAAAAAQG